MLHPAAPHCTPLVSQQCYAVLRKSKLQNEVLNHIWKLSDVNGDGFLDK
jgi:hypothetical protein